MKFTFLNRLGLRAVNNGRKSQHFDVCIRASFIILTQHQMVGYFRLAAMYFISHYNDTGYHFICLIDSE